MKAIGVVVLTESAITLQSNQYEYTEDLKHGDNKSHFIII